MPLSFLNPSLLLGTLAAALPVIIHFLSRRRVQRRQFSDLRFLDEVQARQARSLGIRRWLLLLLRVLALLCVALAAAGPRWGGLDGGGGTRSVLFVLDTSASMNTASGDETRLAAAVRACGEMIRALPGDAAVQVLTVGATARPLFGDWLPAGADAAAGLELVAPTDGTFDLGRALDETARLVARAPGARVQVILVSDLQAMPAQDAWPGAARRLREAGQVQLLVRGVGEGVAGGAVLDVALPGRAVRPGEGIGIRARVVPQFAEQVFVLELDGRPVGEAIAPGPAGQENELVFPLTVPGIGRHLGVVRKETDALPADDVRPFVLEVPARLDVLLVHGRDMPQDGPGGRGGWRYVARALAPGGDDTVFGVTTRRSDGVTTGEIETAAVVILVDPDPLGRRALEGLRRRVEGGGQLVIMAGDPRLNAYLGDTLLPLAGLSPEVGFAADEAGRRSRVVDPTHPVFAGLEEAALETFTEVGWRRWFRLEETGARVLVALADDSPLVLETDVGSGRVVVVAGHLQPASSDLAGSPMALPFIQRLAAWLAGGTVPQGTEVGATARLRLQGPVARDVLADAGDVRVSDPSDTPPLPADVAWEDGEPVVRGGPVTRAGFVVFTAGSDTLGLVAAAVPEAESGLELLGAEGFADLAAELDLPVAGNLTGASAESFRAALGGRDLAGWLILAALALLALELGLGRGAGA